MYIDIREVPIDVAALVYQATIGVHAIDDRILAQYISKMDESRWEEIGVSLFDYQTGDFLSYTRIKELSQQADDPDRSSPAWRVLIMSYNQGKTYIVDRRSGEPEVVVARIEFDIP